MANKKKYIGLLKIGTLTLQLSIYVKDIYKLRELTNSMLLSASRSDMMSTKVKFLQ